ncbi:uncharacterized protein LOC122055684 [Zingiber officinale]|uniref:Uncharacterized protein n=1 Tax=Zingiber officinale TaxID=94328 RepID=A0A8J5LJ06_ZINOF|nr:uncharacterized protein LOC122055684 [Zingiber officinale]KAG6517263.1 hypothetical protein ZIOFF_020643 [Zingiber officinale]
MSRSGRKHHLSRVLDAHISTVQETLRILERPADSGLEKVEWSEVVKLGDEVSKQATMAGMLWSGEAPEMKALEENIGAYCNILHGFILLCHGSTVGAGPTLHANINVSAKQVVECSLALLREAVSSYESRNREKRLSIPQLAGAVWESCTAFKKSPTANCTAIGRAITQVAVSVKDVLREMGELKEFKSTAAPNGSGGEDSNRAPESTSTDEEGDDLAETDIGDDLSAEEMAVAQLIISVVSDTLTAIKELIRYISGLLKSSSLKVNSKESTDSLEKLLSCCREMGSEVNELGASVYPPQEVYQMKSSVEKMHDLVGKMRIEVTSLEGSSNDVFATFKRLESSLANLENGLGNDVARRMGKLVV